MFVCSLIKIADPNIKQILYDLLFEGDLQHCEQIKRLIEENEALKIKLRSMELSTDNVYNESKLTKVTNFFKGLVANFQEVEPSTKAILTLTGITIITLIVCCCTNVDLNALTKATTEYFSNINSSSTQHSINSINSSNEHTKIIIETLNDQNRSLSELSKDLWQQNQKIINMLFNYVNRNTGSPKTKPVFSKIQEWFREDE